MVLNSYFILTSHCNFSINSCEKYMILFQVYTYVFKVQLLVLKTKYCKESNLPTMFKNCTVLHLTFSTTIISINMTKKGEDTPSPLNACGRFSYCSISPFLHHTLPQKLLKIVWVSGNEATMLQCLVVKTNPPPSQYRFQTVPVKFLDLMILLSTPYREF